MHWLVPLLTLITNQYVHSLKWKEVKKKIQIQSKEMPIKKKIEECNFRC